MLKTPQQQARANQQHERHRDLRDHQDVVRSAMPRSACPFAPLLEDSREIRPECAQRRKQPANDPGGHAYGGGERQHLAVQAALS